MTTDEAQEIIWKKAVVAYSKYPGICPEVLKKTRKTCQDSLCTDGDSNRATAQIPVKSTAAKPTPSKLFVTH
jgi:hypothetical protein